MEAIKRDFGSFDQMKEKLNAASVGVQGSGWGWLVSELFLTSLSKNRNNMPLENPCPWGFCIRNKQRAHHSVVLRLRLIYSSGV